MRIAVIGSGISGMVAAHHLSRAHDVTVYEAGSHIGGLAIHAAKHMVAA
jgi:uncharacterized protein